MASRSRTRADRAQTSTRASRKRARDVLTPSSDPPSSPCPSYKRARVPDRPTPSSITLDKENIPCPGSSEDDGAPGPSCPSRNCNRSVSDSDILGKPSLSASRKLSASFSTLVSPPSTPITPHTKARSLLRASNSCTIIGRETEKAVILQFLQDFELESATGPHCLFISGGPGSGKTALLQQLLEEETHAHQQLTSLFFNCMGVCDLQLSTLLGHVMKEAAGSRKLPQTKDFNTFMKNLQQKCILVLDEVDQLCSNATLFSDLVEHSKAHSDYLRIIGIANTHTLTASITSDREGSQTLHFTPYTAAELSSILAARLSPITSERPSFISPSTLLLASRKISSISGDVRLLLSTLSRAVDASAISKDASVTPAHVLRAVQKDKANTSSSASLQATRSLGLQARLALCVLLLALRRQASGLPITSSSPSSSPTKAKTSRIPSSNLSHVSLHSYYTALLRSSPISALSRVEFGDVLSNLEVHGLILISLSQVRGEKGRSFLSLVSGLQEAELLRGLFGEEGKKQDDVKEIWDTESMRITRLVSQLGEKTANDIFSEASQR